MQFLVALEDFLNELLLQKNLLQIILLLFLLRKSLVTLNQIHLSVRLSFRLQTGKLKIVTTVFEENLV